jgi:heparan-alpha-glucosaminide N-acetyltransferase
MSTSKLRSHRLDSIDIFRAVTMCLMIFVNDFWTLENVPRWLLHSAAEADDMGFSDVIFPAFLFIVGLSLPFAITYRKTKGDPKTKILKHILGRTFALLLMGIFLVNFENMHSEAMLIPKYVWEIFLIVSFFLIWNVYPNRPERKSLYSGFRVSGYLLLIVLAAMYQGGTAENPAWLETHWWGILGLIGWSYLICSVTYLYLERSLLLMAIAWIALVLFNLADFAGILSVLDNVRDTIWIVGSGAFPAFTMAGVISSMLYQRYYNRDNAGIFILILVLLGVLSLLYGFGTRPFWGISKIRATPAWLGICTAISFVLYAIFFWLVEVMNVKKWANVLKPAGEATLTCYLIPYIWYAVVTIADIHLSVFFRTGLVGLAKSLLFSLVIICITGLINKFGVRLKI